jgi:pimeloyl-ACP methyl ester carboxylesterase
MSDAATRSLATARTVTFRNGPVHLVADRWDPDPSRGPAELAVILLHGGGQTRRSWRSTGARLAAHGWSAVAVDARGHGDSDWAPDQDYSLTVMVDDLRLVVDQIDLSCALVGASMGGMTALVAEGEHPGLAAALVLVDIVVHPEPAGVQRITQFMRSAQEGFATLDEVADAVRAYNPHRRRPVSPGGLRKNVRLHEDGRWHWHWDPAVLTNGDEPTRGENETRFEAAARRVAVPTLIVRGAESDVVSARAVDETIALLASPSQTLVPGAGHMLVGDDNDVFSAALLEFLAAV